MKVKIFYTRTYDTEVEVDDKFKALLDNTLKPSRRNRLQQELLKIADGSIPIGEVSDVWSDEGQDYFELLASATIFPGPSAP